MDILVKNIEEELELNNQISNELILLEKDRLNKAVQIALKGIKFKKVLSIFGEDPKTGEHRREYLKDSSGKEIKVIYLETIESMKDKHCNEYLVSLVMDNEGKFHVIEKSYPYDYYAGITERRIIRENIDVFSDKPLSDIYLASGYKNKWDIDNIYYEIEENLKDRLASLKERNKKQTERLENIKKILI